ncbi:endonuclease V [Rubrivirga sp. IMCC45206]|uniref:endonuclease V n=1 Tax=Rubrivirga sp. IMCC45206 TaxID=3391614 RepID=UPI00399001D1
MTLHHAHRWDLTPTEAVALQRELAPLVREAPLDLAAVRTVAGLDVSVRDDRVRAAVVVYDVRERAAVDHAIWEGPTPFPYVPGLLSFREVPAILPALEQLEALPDVYMLDAQGLAHPRRFGLACHLGVLLDAPALGVAKSILVGRVDGPLREVKGSGAPLVHRGETVGQALRTREGVKPVYVSVGHRVTLRDAARLALGLAERWKLPQPTHLAHRLSYRGEL